MPYFQRTPITELADMFRLNAGPLPGLPSRGSAPVAGVAANTQPIAPAAAVTGIVDQAVAVLAGEQASGSAAPAAAWGVAPMASAGSVQITQLQEQAHELINQLFAYAGRYPGPAGAAVPLSATVPEVRPLAEARDLCVDPVPVLLAPGPVVPGSATQTTISLANEDTEAAQIAFFSTPLLSELGQHIPAEGVSFQPRELTLPPGKTGEVTVRVAIPAQTRCGVYSGLIRASKLDYLHAVLVVQVKER